MTTFDESLHPRQTKGQFANKATSAPTGSLVAPVVPVSVHMQQQNHAAAMFLAAKHAHLRANVAAAAAHLRELFPDATAAVFTRSWDDMSGTIALSHIRRDDIELDLSEPRDEKQDESFVTATRLIGDLGDDAGAYLQEPDVETTGWDEYHLDLSGAPAIELSSETFLSHLTESTRNSLDSALADCDGRLASMIDTTELVYQLEEGRFLDQSPKAAEKLITKYGSAQAAAKAIIETDAYFEFREKTADEIHETTPRLMALAAAEALKA